MEPLRYGLDRAQDALTSTDWRLKALAAGVSILLLHVARDWLLKLRLQWRLRKFPLVNPQWGPQAQKDFQTGALSLLRKGAAEFSGQPFRLNDYSQGGAKICVPPRYLEEYKNHPGLHFGMSVFKDWYADYPGYEPFATAGTGIFQDAVREQLGGVVDWTEIQLRTAAIGIIARLTTLIFLGEKYMDNEDWQEVQYNYIMHAFIGTQVLNALPPFVRPIAHWFIPQCKAARADVAKAHQLITPEVEARLEEIRQHGKPRRRVLDSVDWFVAAAKGRKFDVPVAEISLAMAATNGTSQTLIGLVHDLIMHPEYLQDLREEFVAALEEMGKLDKSVLSKMVKMDSFMRESFRTHPHSDANMIRYIRKDVNFSDGTTLPQGSYAMIYPPPQLNPSHYSNPEMFDGYRFLRLRQQPGAENKYQAVTVSPEFTFFGLGTHSCPGRGFATSELKILLGYIVLHYDLNFPDGVTPDQFNTQTPVGFVRRPDPGLRIMARKRTPEVDFAAFVRKGAEEAEVAKDA